MAFKFNFGQGSVINQPVEIQDKDSQDQEAPLQILQIEQQIASSLHFDTIWLTEKVGLLKGNVASQHASIAMKSGVLAVSDLVPGKYEGGFKLWECGIDLACHLCGLWGIDQNFQSFLQSESCRALTGKSVLELGCGHGLPGILCACLKMNVDFQDYNEEVLSNLTMPNLQANLKEISASDFLPRSRFFSGSWSSLAKSLDSDPNFSQKYDYILSSDTIYSVASQPVFLECLQKALKKGGLAMIAAKSYYFGVGGSTDGFKKLMQNSAYFKLIDTVVIDDRASNKREIITFERI